MKRLNYTFKKLIKALGKGYAFLMLTLLITILSPAQSLASSLSPTINTSFDGAYNQFSSPSSATIAANSSQEVQLVNGYYNIYDRSGSNLGSGTMNQLAGTKNFFSSDQQVLYLLLPIRIKSAESPSDCLSGKEVEP